MGYLLRAHLHDYLLLRHRSQFHLFSVLVGNWLKNIFLFLTPVFALMAVYFTLDPFAIVGPLESTKLNPIASSDDYYGVERFLLNVQEGEKYNSFVFGNSKTLAFEPDALCTESECAYYNFGAPGESITNIHSKLKLILDEGQELKLALVVLDHKILLNENNSHPNFKGPVYEHHPRVSQSSWIEFHMNFIKYFVRDFFFFDFLKWKLTEKWEPSFEGKISRETSSESVAYSRLQNFSTRVEAEGQITKDPDAYYSNMEAEMTKKNRVTHQLELSLKQLNLLREMNQIFQEQNTKFNIVLGPYWNSDQLDQTTIAKIRECFGEDRVFDFTGDNQWNLDMEKWYESNHYRPLVGSSNMNQVRGTGF